jgi:hypothetical protein
MPSKTPAVVSVILTLSLLLILSAVLSFGQLVAFNGYSERVGGIGLGTSLICQGIGNILSAIIAWRLTHRLITKSNWGKVPAVLVSTLAGLFTGLGLSFLSLILSTFLAEQLR